MKASLGDEAGMARALQGARRYIHLATGNGDDWETVKKVMVDGSARVAEQCAEAGVERLVYVSSIAALYTGPDGAASSIADSWDTDAQLDKRPIYARGKAEAEKALKAIADRTGLKLVVTRPGVVLGEGTPMQHSGLGLWVRDNHYVGWDSATTPCPSCSPTTWPTPSWRRPSGVGRRRRTGHQPLRQPGDQRPRGRHRAPEGHGRRIAFHPRGL